MQVLVYSFRVILGLLHPLAPFVTERLWQALPHSGPALIAAAWPQHQAASDPHALICFQVQGSLSLSSVFVSSCHAENCVLQ